ncbi:VOC family protein [Segetibacter koreensis]|uniref:VOC family protein n=1 Tax=Segetibacter koreensis TaxID=398037 RepID=UPI00146D2606|nr:VOC family protein [Segetibacter koreensis]
MHLENSFIGSRFGQIAWVVPDIQSAEKFFREVIGVQEFVKMENLRADQLEGMAYGKPGNFVFHLYMTYSGGSLLELIQPVSGQSIFQDYLDKHPQGGVQHIAFMVPETELRQCVSGLTDKGYSSILSLTLPVAKVSFFDTTKEIGVFTEIIGVTEAGVEFVERLKTKAA